MKGEGECAGIPVCLALLHLSGSHFHSRQQLKQRTKCKMQVRGVEIMHSWQLSALGIHKMSTSTIRHHM